MGLASNVLDLSSLAIMAERLGDPESLLPSSGDFSRMYIADQWCLIINFVIQYTPTTIVFIASKYSTTTI